MIDFATDQNLALAPANAARPGLIRRVSGIALRFTARIKPAVIWTWEAYRLRRRRAAERQELRDAGFQVWHDLGPGRVAEEVGKPASRK